jgi:hypothetical protein
MSANNQPPEVLSGDYLAYAVVNDFGTDTQSEEWVSYPMGGNTISNGPEAVEATLHGNPITQQYPRHGTITCEGTLASVPGNDQFATLGLTDENGDWKTKNAVADIEAFRVHIYDDVPDPSNDPQSSYEFVGCKLHVGEITHSVGDPGEEPFVLMVNGNWRPYASPPPSDSGGTTTTTDGGQIQAVQPVDDSDSTSGGSSS